MDITQQFVEAAQGTCLSHEEIYRLLEWDDETEWDDIIDWEEVDNCIFRCETCSWWCELGEDDEEGNCEDCAELD